MSTKEQAVLKKRKAFALHALLAYSISVLLTIFLGSLLQFYNMNLGFIATEIVLIGIPAAVVLFAHRKTVNVDQFLMPNIKQFLLTALIGTCVAVIGVYQGIVVRKTLLEVDTSGINMAGSISLFLLAILPPFCEELLFRPVIQSSLARHWNSGTTVILTAVLFALFHLSLIRFAETFVLGFFVGIVFLKTRCFWCPVTVHFIGNAIGPILWRNATHLAFLLNPIMITLLTCVAFASCYFLGERSQEQLKGLLQYFKWAAFGTPQFVSTKQIKSKRVVVLTGIIVTCLIILISYSHSIMISQLNEPKYKSNYIISEEDEWEIFSEKIVAYSALVIKKIPESYEDLILQLPFQEATLQSVQFGNNSLSFSQREPNEYNIDLSNQQHDLRLNSTIIVIWSFPVTCLTPPSGKWGYMVPLKSLAPSNSFSLTVTITDKSQFKFSFGENGLRTKQVFSNSVDKAKMDYGNWSGLKKNK